jgi:hypothetical protein
MGGLLASVILTEAGNVALQVMGIHGLAKPLADGSATIFLAPAHLVPPVRPDYAILTLVKLLWRLILPSTEGS